LRSPRWENPEQQPRYPLFLIWILKIRKINPILFKPA
jgi:hypothetical protein